MTLDPRSISGRVLLTALVAFGPLSTDLYLPSLPAIGAALATDIGSVQLTLSVFLAGFACAQLAMGPLSDRYGRKPVLMGGIALYLASAVACAFADSIETLIALRFLQAVGACSGPVIGRAIVRDVYGPHQAGSVLAYMAAAMALAPLVAPFIGGQLTAHFGWRANFVALAVIGATILAAVVVKLPETIEQRSPDAIRLGRMIGNYGALLKSPTFVGNMLANAFIYAGLFGYISGAPFVFIGLLGVAPENFGFCFGIGVFGFIAGSTAAGRLAHGLGAARLMVLGAALSAASGIILAALTLAETVSLVSILAPMVVYGAGIGLVMPLAMARAIGPFPRMAGAAAALVGFIQMSLGAVAGLLVGQFHDGTAVPMAVVIAVMGVATLAAALMPTEKR